MQIRQKISRIFQYCSGEEQARYLGMVRDFICPVSKGKGAECKQDKER